MDIIAFDLSTACTGVAMYKRKGSILRTTSLMPPEFDATRLGYLKKKYKVKTKKGEYLNSYVVSKDEILTKTEKTRRDSEVRNEASKHTLRWLAQKIDTLLEKEKPELIVSEKLMVFGGVLTTKALAEVHGILHGLAAAKMIPIIEYNVHTVRAKFKLSKLVQEFAEGKTPQQLKAIPDLGKEVLRQLMQEKYGVKMATTDESDAVVILDHHLEEA